VCECVSVPSLHQRKRFPTESKRVSDCVDVRVGDREAVSVSVSASVSVSECMSV
jgi:hypothetical protein